MIIVNDNSLDSCIVGRHYAQQRGLGQNNIAHVKVPASYWLTFDEFRSLRDQLIKYLQDNTLAPDAPPAPVCTDGDGPYYCQASIDHLRAHTQIRYLVTTRGVPTRATIDGSTLPYNSSTSVDNYLAYWLLRYFSTDTRLDFREREIAFGDGRGMRTVAPAIDGELIAGRIDGVNQEAAIALIDRIIDAEDNGIYGKLYGSRFGKYVGRAQWYDYSTNELVYGSSSTGVDADSWRYQLGLFGESRPDCVDYLNYSRNSSAGKAPQDCRVRFSESSPGTASSRTPLVDDALVYLGNLHGQITGAGNFDNLLNWTRDTTCSVKLCEEATDPATCSAQSTDAFKEINTSCVGLAEGFMGFNYMSFPVSYLTVWPTGWKGPKGGSTNNLAFPEVREDTGFDDNYSLWFRNTDTTLDPLCYAAASDLANPASLPCRDERRIALYQEIPLSPQAVTDPSQQYRISFRYQASNITAGSSIKVGLKVYEPTANNWLDYGTQTVASFTIGDPAWTPAQATFTLDPALHTQADTVFSRIEIYISTGNYTGDLGLDQFSIQEVTSGAELAQNPSFAGGHKSVSGGDFAANYLNRLNGVAFWGSVSHHESGGHSFGTNPMETILYFLRGLPLGDAVWWGEGRNSGILYGDPVYSPVAIRLDYHNEWDYLTGNAAIYGSTVNGRDLTAVTTGYSVDYCVGNDFYLCDQAGSWFPTGISGSGGQENMLLGNWDTTALLSGDYVLRLAVTSNNPSRGRSQTLYDYYPVTVSDPAADDDGDGLNNDGEVSVYGTNPKATDTDADGLSDGNEVLVYGSNPLSADSDNDGLPDNWEVAFDTDPMVADAAADPDNDGLGNIGEYNAGTDPSDEDSDDDGLSDGDEINIYGTNPLRIDTDFDKITDYDEIHVYQTDPLSAVDFDYDGMPGDWETARGTDPVKDDAREDPDNDGVDNVIEYLRDTLPLDAGSTPVLNTLFVDSANTSGVEDGSITYPYDTLGEGIAAAQAGDSLQLAAGTYNLGFFYYSNPVRIIGTANGGTVLEATYFLPGWVAWGSLENVTLDLSNYLYIYNSRNLVFRNCVVQAANGTSVLSNSKARFENCRQEYVGAATAISVDGTSSIELVNNTIAGFGTGIYSGAGDAVTLRNSILANPVDLQGVSDASLISYSLISDGQFAGTNGVITGDPLFVDPGTDFHLQPTSPAIDAGDPADDYSAEPMPNGCRVNLGAYGGTVDAATSPDPDNDGLAGYCEVIAGTDPDHPDTDHDGILDGTDSDPLDLFSPNPEGLTLSPAGDFSISTTSYLSTDTLYILTWSNIIGAGATATFTVEGGLTVLSGNFSDRGDGSYIASAALADLNYSGTDVLVKSRLQIKRNRFITEQTVTVSSPPPTGTVPIINIDAPLDGAQFTFADPVDFSGTANDAEDGDLTTGIAWDSSIDGPIGTGGTITTTTLSDGTHTITASVTDSHGNQAQQSITVTVETPSNDAVPTINIDTPSSGARYSSGESIAFSGTANDTKDGDLTAGIAWNSSIDGPLGTGGTITTTLSDGTHTITASVTDSHGNEAQQSITITVESAVTITLEDPPAVRTRGKNTLVDLTWSGATAEFIDIYINDSLIATVTNSGRYTDNVGKDPSGTFSYKVCETNTLSCSDTVTVDF